MKRELEMTESDEDQDDSKPSAQPSKRKRSDWILEEQESRSSSQLLDYLSNSTVSDRNQYLLGARGSEGRNYPLPMADPINFARLGTQPQLPMQFIGSDTVGQLHNSMNTSMANSPGRRDLFDDLSYARINLLANMSNLGGMNMSVNAQQSSHFPLSYNTSALQQHLQRSTVNSALENQRRFAYVDSIDEHQSSRMLPWQSANRNQLPLELQAASVSNYLQSQQGLDRTRQTLPYRNLPIQTGTMTDSEIGRMELLSPKFQLTNDNPTARDYRTSNERIESFQPKAPRQYQPVENHGEARENPPNLSKQASGGKDSAYLSPDATPENVIDRESKGANAARFGYKPGKLIPLSMSSDKGSLSMYQCLLREQICLFEAGDYDISCIAQGRNKPVQSGQVGIVCRHCSSIPPGLRSRGAVYFPTKLKGLYQAVQNMGTNHFLNSCRNIPEHIRTELQDLKDAKPTVLGGGKQFWAYGARLLGVIETDEDLRFKKDE